MSSSTASSLAILTHSEDGFWQRPSVVRLLIPVWQAMGVRVEVVTELDPFFPAPLALLHVTRSVVHDATRRLMRRYPRVLNSGVLDIRKRTFSRLALGRRDPYDRPVIVKTDCNYHGLPEFTSQITRGWIGRLLRRVHASEPVILALMRLEGLRPWQRRRILLDYPVYRHLGDVPAGVWRNPDLLVERFMAERAGDGFCCRHWLFFGDAEVSRRTTSSGHMVKVSGRPEQMPVDVPLELRRVRERLGFDYGKFDYGVIDGEVVLYDVNRTPGATADPANHLQTVETLARGIGRFL
jgi:hypothetical protein